MVQERNIFTNQ
uniref:Uncharacterized protein n=1 Tax=Lepeophtheirus salmonis TaxID=72036 RepID=A0A0K2V2K3_LEPSM